MSVLTLSCIYDRLATELSGLTWAGKTELSDGLDGDSDLDGNSDNLGQLKNTIRADI